jgi:hypothetical protein
MLLRLIGELYDFVLKGFFVIAIVVIVLYNAIEAIDDFKKKRKLKKENKDKEP